MLKEETSVLNIDINNWARTCDNCRSAACTVYCHADSAYFCAGCDARIHAASRHDRVFVCEACERAPAAFLCKADSASLCVACDADVHSANPLARRHHRVPILPIHTPTDDHDSVFEGIEDEEEDESATWLLLNPTKNVFSYGGEAMDEYLDLADYNNNCQDNNHFTDQYSVVPVQNEIKFQIQQQHNYQSANEYGYSAPTSHSVSVSSMDVGVVPESTGDVSISYPRTPKGTIDLFSSPPVQMPIQLNPMDREARVLRYREKKKTRKFEKTIRYASRKAYAETRPRVKGRFAKRTSVEVEVDQMFSSSVLSEGGYGIVPLY